MTDLAVSEEVQAMIRLHDLSDADFQHDDVSHSLCSCRAQVVAARPNVTGDVCANCGGMAVRTGTCTTCMECGTSGGCG